MSHSRSQTRATHTPHAGVVIIDYGSQYTQLIARRVREAGVYSVIVPHTATLSRIVHELPHAVILSGGPNSVYDEGAPQLPEGFLDWQERERVPVLGICYGLQLLVHTLGGKVAPAQVREYGRMGLKPVSPSQLIQAQSHSQVWMSHGDEVKSLPPGFMLTTVSETGAVAAIENFSARMYALQFHPEVTHSEGGRELLHRFLFEVAGLQANWKMSEFAAEAVAQIREQVGSEGTVLCGLSGGVDSTVAAVLVSRAVGKRLQCVFVDHGLLREGERDEVMRMFQNELGLQVTCADEKDVFLRALSGVDDPEQKRKIIGREFIRAFERQAARFGSPAPKFLVQGTLYPDVVESSAGPSHTIKSHHNVGGLPSDLNFKLVEPLRELFKDEVRELGRALGVPAEFVKRHPFPGPGLAVRVMGEVTPDRLWVLRQADQIFTNEIKKAGLYSQIWQAFAVYLPIRTVGVKGDGRTHEPVISLRAVTSTDGMTAESYEFEPSFLTRVASRICNEVKGVSRVVYDVTSKPPATIEWE